MARVLIAEDDVSVREFVARALRVDGHTVMLVDDGLRALKVLEEKVFDLVIADIIMPQVNGIALAMRIAEEHPDLPVLLMSGYASERERAGLLEAPRRAVLPKPFSLQDICEAASRAVAHRGSKKKLN